MASTALAVEPTAAIATAEPVIDPAAVEAAPVEVNLISPPPTEKAEKAHKRRSFIPSGLGEKVKKLIHKASPAKKEKPAPTPVAAAPVVEAVAEEPAAEAPAVEEPVAVETAPVEAEAEAPKEESK